MVKVFSFCIYGSGKKYIQGLVENIRLITKEFPDFEIWVYQGKGVPELFLNEYKKYPAVKLIPTSGDGAGMMITRFLPIDNPDVEVMFSRDADSRILARDVWCIRNFLSSDKKVHSIRDHFWHQVYLNGGMWGCKQGAFTSKIADLYAEWTGVKNNYGSDQGFLKRIYEINKDQVLVHTNMIVYKNEPYVEIPEELFDNDNFVGNVYEYFSTEINEIDQKDESYPSFMFFDADFIKNLPRTIAFLHSQDAQFMVDRILKHEGIFKNY